MNRRDVRPPGPETPVYVISVAAELTGLHPQTLRTYDRLGLVSPGRTGGGGRRYSLRDIEMLREIAHLSAMGIGMEGVRRILELENHVAALQLRVAELEARLADTDAVLAGRTGSVVNLPAVPFAPPSQTVVVWRRPHH
jgi:MerR family transcriptional regulator, heat shock protein HspR